MKGPFERLKYEFFRLWECPVCKAKARSAGSTTYLFCPCQTTTGGKSVGMRLVGDGGRRADGKPEIKKREKKELPQFPTETPESPPSNVVQE